MCLEFLPISNKTPLYSKRLIGWEKYLSYSLFAISESRFGFKNIAIIDGCDVFDPKTVRASMGAIFKMNVEIFKTFEEYKNSFEENNIYSFILNKDSVSLKNVEIKKPFTLMFGNESHGLENFDLNGTTPVFIEQSEDIDSFNLPIASSIAMYKFTEK